MAKTDPIIMLLKNKYDAKFVEVKGSKIIIRVDDSSTVGREKEAKALKKFLGRAARLHKPASQSVSGIKIEKYSINIKPKPVGGTGSSSTKKGRTDFGPLKQLAKKDKSYKLIPPDDVNEIYLMNDFHKMLNPIYNEHGPITIKLGRYTFKNIVGMNANAGTPKSDISLVSWDGKKLTNIAFLSYKKAGGAKAFQQYGGLSKSAGDVIFEHKMTKKWRDDIVKLQKSGFKKSGSGGLKKDVFRKISNTGPGKKIKNLITYGPDFGKSKFGEENCHVIAQGNIGLVKTGRAGVYKMTFTDEIVNNGDAWKSKGGYEHVYGARNGSGRNVIGTDGQTAKGIRIGIFPRRYRAAWMQDTTIDKGGHKY